jgi:hypothetical protein
MDTDGLFPKQQGYEADHSSAYSAEVNNGGATPSLSQTPS